MKFKFQILILVLISFNFARAELSSLLPNSLSYQSAQSTTALRLSNNQSVNVDTQSFNSGEISQFVSRLQFKKVNLKSNQFFDLDWGPTGSFAFFPFAIDSSDVFFSETDFQFMRALIGYGPEARLNFEFGSFAVSVSPGLQYSWVSWSSPISAGSFDRFETSLSGSVQFLKVIHQNIFLQVFYEVVLEDHLTWEKAMTSSQGFVVDVKQVNTSIFGLSIGYSWN